MVNEEDKTKNVTAACTAGTGENATMVADAQATVTENPQLSAEALWDSATPVAKYIGEDGWWIVVRKTADGRYLSQTEVETKFHTGWAEEVESMKTHIRLVCNKLTGREIAPVCINALVDEMMQTDPYILLEFWYSKTPKDNTAKKVLTAYGLI